MGIEVDYHEPYDIARLIEPVMEVSVAGLNDADWADYKWTGEVLSNFPKHSGVYHLERKTWGDLANGVDEIEDLLRRQYQAHPDAKLRLVIEGAGEPALRGVMVYSRASGRNLMTSKSIGNQPGAFKKILGTIAGWQEFVEVYNTTSYPGTALLLVELYQRDQRPESERTTFSRHFKTISWHPNTQVQRLLGAVSNDSDVGVKKAEDLIAVYGTAWAVMSADPKEMARKVRGISENGARLILRKFGRLDV